MQQLNLWLNQLSQQHCPDLNEAIEYLGQILPLLHQLKTTPQDSQWHAEGDVHIHTQMVIDECYLILQNEGRHINGKARQSLILACLLHDIAKPLCTEKTIIDNIERTISPKHDVRGSEYLAKRLPQTDLCPQVIQQVIALVGNHHKPKYLVIKKTPQSDYQRVAQQVSMALLYYLELADMRGRTCESRPYQLKAMEDFKQYCQQYQLWFEGDDNLLAQWCG